MADIELVIKIDEKTYEDIKNGKVYSSVRDVPQESVLAIANGTPLTPDMLADLLMEERIRGKLKQDISYSKDIIDDVRCKLTVDIIDRRPCYCGAELRETWRGSK